MEGSMHNVFTDLNPLANPRGVVQACELCGTTARYICKTCRVSYYCTREHKMMDERLIHPQICDIIAFIRKPIGFIIGIRERLRLQKQKDIKKGELIERVLDCTRRSLLENRAHDALGQVAHGIRAAMELYGPDNYRILPCLLVMIEALVRRGRLHHAKGHLSKAKWILLSSAECPDRYRADYYKNEGLLNAALKDHDAALNSYANEAFYAAKEFHSEHARTSSGFFHLGQVFLAANENIIAYSFFMHTVEIWIARLTEAFRHLTAPSDVPTLAVILEGKTSGLSQREQKDALEALRYIMDHTVSVKWKAPASHSAKVCLALGLYYYTAENYNEAQTMADQALEFARSSDTPSLLEPVQELYKFSARKCVAATLQKSSSLNMDTSTA